LATPPEIDDTPSAASCADRPAAEVIAALFANAARACRSTSVVKPSYEGGELPIAALASIFAHGERHCND
jgi:hypothetical protein